VGVHSYYFIPQKIINKTKHQNFIKIINSLLPMCAYLHEINIQGVSRLVDITAKGDFLGICDQKTSYKYVSGFGWLRSYDRLKLRREGKDNSQ
jgi:hypothetical protein